MIKKLLAALLAAVLLLPAAGCGSVTAQDARVRIVCTAFPQYDFLREITAGVPGVDLTLLLKPGQESHDYDPSSQDILTIHACDMFVYVGGESDTWIDGVLSSVETKDKTVLTLLDIVQALPEETAEGMEKAEEEEEPGYDEHVWTAPLNAAAITDALCTALCARDTAYADTYRKNAAVYREKLVALDADFKSAVAAGARKTIVVADRFPLLYFCKAYGLQYHAAFAGCAASVEPSSATVEFLIGRVKAEKIPVIFRMELSAGQVAETVRENTGCKVETFYACHNLSRQDLESGATYLSLMQKNLTVLKEALA